MWWPSGAALLLFALFLPTMPSKLPPTSPSSSSPPPSSSARRQCVPISVQQCGDLANYTHTSMPTVLGHRTQAEAAEYMDGFSLLLQSNCHPQMLLLLCSVVTPICVPEFPDTRVPVCRQVCHRAEAKCRPVMQVGKYEWPAVLNCHNFPEWDPDSKAPMCMDPDSDKNVEGTRSTVLIEKSTREY